MKTIRIWILTLLFVLVEWILINYIYYSTITFAISLILVFAYSFRVAYIIEQPNFTKKKIKTLLFFK